MFLNRMLLVQNPHPDSGTNLSFLCLQRRHGQRVQVDSSPIVLTMRKRLDRIRFRGQKRDDFVDLAESPYASDTECTEEMVIKSQPSLRFLEDLRYVDGGEPQSDSQVRRHT